MSDALDNRLAALKDILSDNKLPPVHSWQPTRVSDIDMRIARNGDWFYRDSLIQRPRMVKLFSTVLRKDDDGHTYLVTPQDKLRIVVDDAPFTAVLLDVHKPGPAQTLVFTSNTGDQTVADAAHPIVVEYHSDDGEPSPYITVRDRLRALLSRAVFYQLAMLAVEVDGVNGVYSDGVFMPLAEQ